MKAVIHRLKSRFKGTWIHHAVWAYRNPPPKARGSNDKNVASTYQDAKYNWQTIKVMFRVLHPTSNCIDVGAHVGEILWHMTDIAPRGKHYAFEPLPHLSQQLTENFPQVVVHQAAVSERSGESEFLFVQNDPGYSGLRRRIYDRPDPKVIPIRVRVVTLDEIIPLNERIAFIKIDIEGGEFHAVKGGINTIRRCKPIIIFEGGSRSTGQYGVKPHDFYLLMSETLGYELSTMERWLRREAPYDREEFENNWNQGPEYYFIGTPKGRTRHS